MIRFRCEGCGHRIKVADKHAGRKGKCPKCGRVVRVPRAVQKELALNGVGRGNGTRRIPESTAPGHAGAGHGGNGRSGARSCPRCGGAILAGAIKCMHCGTPLYELRTNPALGFTRQEWAQDPHGPGPIYAAVVEDGLAARNPKDDSPLSNYHLEVLNEAERFRRCIRHAALWFRLQYLLWLIATIVSLPLVFLGVAMDNSFLAATLATLITATLGIGLVVLLYLVYQATWDCHRWAPMTMLVLNGVGVACYLVGGLAGNLINKEEALLSMTHGICGAVFPAIIAILCYRAWAAIPKFESLPAWSQQTLIHCGL